MFASPRGVLRAGKTLARSQRLTDLRDGRVELTLRMRHLTDAKNTAIQWGAHVEVLSPPELREEVRPELTKALTQYA